MNSAPEITHFIKAGVQVWVKWSVRLAGLIGLVAGAVFGGNFALVTTGKVSHAIMGLQDIIQSIGGDPAVIFFFIIGILIGGILGAGLGVAAFYISIVPIIVVAVMGSIMGVIDSGIVYVVEFMRLPRMIGITVCFLFGGILLSGPFWAVFRDSFLIVLIPPVVFLFGAFVNSSVSREAEKLTNSVGEG